MSNIATDSQIDTFESLPEGVALDAMASITGLQTSDIGTATEVFCDMAGSRAEQVLQAARQMSR